MATLGGSAIFGDQVKQIGPRKGYRAQRHYLPGIDGCRVYRLGADVLTIQITGRLVGTSRANLETVIAAGNAMRDGQLRTFVGDGGTYANCLLEDYSPGPIQRVTSGSNTHTCTVSAVLVQVST